MLDALTGARQYAIDTLGAQQAPDARRLRADANLAQWQKDHPQSVPGAAAGRSGGGAAQGDAIQGCIASQTQELDLLRQTDPVQQEMIRNRALLATATDAERAAIEQAIRTRLDETPRSRAQGPRGAP